MTARVFGFHGSQLGEGDAQYDGGRRGPTHRPITIVEGKRTAKSPLEYRVLRATLSHVAMGDLRVRHHVESEPKTHSQRAASKTDNQASGQGIQKPPYC